MLKFWWDQEGSFSTEIKNKLYLFYVDSEIFNRFLTLKISSLRTSFFLSDIRSVDVHDEEHVNPKEVGRLHPAPSQSKEVEETPGTFTTTSDAYPLHHRTLATVNREDFLNSHIPERWSHFCDAAIVPHFRTLRPEVKVDQVFCFSFYGWIRHDLTL